MHLVDAVPTAASPLDINLDCDERIGCGWFDSSYELGEGLVVTEDMDLCTFELWLAVAPAQRVAATVH